MSNHSKEPSKEYVTIGYDSEEDFVDDSLTIIIKCDLENATRNLSPLNQEDELCSSGELEEITTTSEKTSEQTDFSQNSGNETQTVCCIHSCENVINRKHKICSLANAQVKMKADFVSKNWNYVCCQHFTHNKHGESIKETKQPFFISTSQSTDASAEATETEKVSQELKREEEAHKNAAAADTNLIPPEKPSNKIYSKQTECCILNCPNSCSNRLFKSIAATGSPMKEGFSDKGHTYICDSCYFKYRYLLTKMKSQIQQPTEEDEAEESQEESTHSETTLSTVQFKKEKESVQVQQKCCVLHCKNALRSRCRKSALKTLQLEFKPHYLSKMWDRICSSHYAKDRKATVEKKKSLLVNNAQEVMQHKQVSNESPMEEDLQEEESEDYSALEEEYVTSSASDDEEYKAKRSPSKKRKVNRDGQIDCCILNCTKACAYSRDTLKTTVFVEFKTDYLNKGWEYICSFHYNKDKNLHEKQTKMQQTSDSVEEEEESVATTKRKKPSKHSYYNYKLKSGQRDCCIENCNNPCYYQRKVLKNGGYVFKAEYTSKGWNQICRYHYNKDIRDFKRKTSE